MGRQFSKPVTLADLQHDARMEKRHQTEQFDAAVVCADVKLFSDGLFEVCDIHWNWLRKAEFVPPEVASGNAQLSRTETTGGADDEEVEVPTEGTEVLWEFYDSMRMEYNLMSEVTLKKLMEELKKQVAKLENRTTWGDDSEFQLVLFLIQPEQSSSLLTPQGTAATEAVSMLQTSFVAKDLVMKE